MTELADVLDLESSVFGRESSTLSSRTRIRSYMMDPRMILAYGVGVFFALGGVALIIFAIRAKHDPSKIRRG